MLGIWIALIVVFFSFSRSKEDLYILPVYPAAAALVGGLLARFIGEARSQQQAFLRWTTIALAASFVGCGAVIIFFFGRGTQPYEIGGANLIGLTAIIGGIASVAATIVKKPTPAVLSTALSVAICNWAFVLWALPDFERFKPVRPLCEIIAAEAGEHALVGYYRTAYPSMSFYLRRPIFEYYHQDEIDSALTSGKEIFCVMTEADFQALRVRAPAQIQVLASHPIFQVKLNGILDRVEPPRVVLISNRGGPNVTQ
jgi:4-amino-4-deoxy-L-arabinose transferase-like glycosyltransferase